VGEYFIRLDAAKEICELVKLKDMTTRAAAEHVIRDEVAKLKGGEGGVIVLSRTSDPVWSYNTLGMFRARQVEDEAAEIVVK
jgi:beta-aspartyl-peptidase (threonine type)